MSDDAPETVHVATLFSREVARSSPRRGRFTANGKARLGSKSRTKSQLEELGIGFGSSRLGAGGIGALARVRSVRATGEPENGLLTVAFHVAGQRCVLVLRGELVRASIGVLEARVDELGQARCDQVIVDVSNVTTIDATGKSVLVGLYHYVRAAGGMMTVIGAGPRISLELAGSPLAELLVS